MADEARPLSDEERAELEALRAEKAARERAELEALRAAHEGAPSGQPTASAPEPAASARPVRRAAETEQDRRIREQRERGARLMEPDDDLRMPLGQKVVLGVLALVVLIIVLMAWITSHR